jgi:hypothetical protein
MADFDDVNLDTSSNEGNFEGFTPEDVIKAKSESRCTYASAGANELMETQ